MNLKLEYLGTSWAFGGDLFTLTDSSGDQARVYVDSIGETWVDVRRIPEGGYFHSERVTAYRVFDSAAAEEQRLLARGFGDKRIAPYAHRVRERGL
jgi:hypothetical protein